MSPETIKTLTVVGQTILVFATAVLMFLIALGIKIIIKRPARANPDMWLEAKFDIFRVGSDLALLGLGTYLTVLEMSWKEASGSLVYLLVANAVLVGVQLLLLVMIIAFMSYNDSAKSSSWFWGVYVPLFFGGCSVVLSLITMLALLLG